MWLGRCFSSYMDEIILFMDLQVSPKVPRGTFGGFGISTFVLGDL